MRIKAFTVDSGDGERVDEVYRWVLRHEKKLKAQKRFIHSLKGSSSKTMASMVVVKRLETVTRKGVTSKLARGVPHFEVNTNMAKHSLYAVLGLGIDGEISLESTAGDGQRYVWPGRWDAESDDAHLAGQTSRFSVEAYFGQLTGEEYALIESRTGPPRRQWRVITGRQNHMLDAEVYQRAQAVAHRIETLGTRTTPAGPNGGPRGTHTHSQIPADAGTVLRGG